MPRGTQTIETPGAAAAAEQPDTGAPEAEQSAAPQLAPDIAALVAAGIAAGVKQALAKRASPAALADADLPTQAEAVKSLAADPDRRSILSKDGWVVRKPPKRSEVARDENGFALS